MNSSITGVPAAPCCAGLTGAKEERLSAGREEQRVMRAADPGAWAQIGSVLPASNPFTFTDTNAAQFPMRFYRVLNP